MINKIIHLSNFNIKSSEYYNDEYEQIIMKLYFELDAMKNDNILIVICGGLLFSDTINSFVINTCKNIIDNFTKIAPLIIITDEKTRIIENIFNNVNNLFFLEKGFENYFKLDNIIFGSLKSDINIVIPDNYRKICIDYINHQEIINNPKLINRIDYELILLGGYHEFKFLDDTHSVAYSGNIIQFGFKDNYENHGFIIWDLNNNTTFKNIKNDYCYLKLKYDNNKFKIYKKNELIDFNINWIPQYPNLYIEYDCKKKDCMDLINKYFPNYNEIIFNYMINKSISYDNELFTNRETIIKNEINKLKNKEIIPRLVDYTSKTINEFNPVKSNCEIYNIELTDLYFSNFFGFGLKNYVSFDKDGILGINGANAVGKSSLFNIITYLLCGKPNNNLLNYDSDFFLGILRFKINGQEYKIVKLGIKKDESYSLFSRLYIYDKDIYILKLKKDIDNLMNKYFNSFDIINKIFILNNKSNEFINLSEFLKIDFISTIYNVTYFDDLYNYVKDKIAIDKHEYNIIKKDIDQFNENDIKISIQSIKNKEDELISSYESQKNNFLKNNNINNKFAKSFNKIININTELNNVRTELIKKKFIYDDFIKKKDRFLNIKNELTIKRTLLDIVSKKGLSGSCLNQILHVIKCIMNEFLSEICNFKVNFSDVINMEIIDDKNNKTSLFSGYQTFILTLAFRYAICKTSIYRPSFIFIDEGDFGSFDNENKKKICVIFDILKNKFKNIFIISHLEVVKAEIDYNIYIKKDKLNKSSINTSNKPIKDEIFKKEIDELNLRGINKAICIEYFNDKIIRL